jgi:cyclase
MQSLRIIPCLDVKQGRVVKGIGFRNLRDAGDPVELGAYYSDEGADELVFLDISASQENRSTLVEMAKAVARGVFIPFTVGGGIRDRRDVEQLLSAGADKVSINSQAVANPSLIGEIASVFGSQCCVVAMDVKRTPRGFEIFTHGGTRPTGIDAIEWLRKVEELGAGEVLVTSMDRDGTKDGYDLALMEEVLANSHIPVIASGGVGSLEHFIQAASAGVFAMLAASVFHYQELTIAKVKEALLEQGFVVRPVPLTKQHFR